MPRPMTRAEMVNSFWPHSHYFMSQEEMTQLQAKGVVYHQIIVPLTEEQKQTMSEEMSEENKVDTEEKQALP
jgi:hypothetical protein